jgi:hypothetical protein
MIVSLPPRPSNRLSAALSVKVSADELPRRPSMLVSVSVPCPVAVPVVRLAVMPLAESV